MWEAALDMQQMVSKEPVKTLFYQHIVGRKEPSHCVCPLKQYQQIVFYDYLLI